MGIIIDDGGGAVLHIAQSLGMPSFNTSSKKLYKGSGGYETSKSYDTHLSIGTPLPGIMTLAMTTVVVHVEGPT